MEEQQLPPESSAYSDICTYWAANPAFDPQRMLLRRLLFLNTNKTKYVSVGFYPARDYLPLVEFGVIRICGSNAIILTESCSTRCLSMYRRLTILCGRRGRS